MNEKYNFDYVKFEEQNVYLILKMVVLFPEPSASGESNKIVSYIGTFSTFDLTFDRIPPI